MKLFIIVTTVLVTFSGCFDAREIDDLVHITVIGIDKGATNNWRITVQFPSQKANAGSSGAVVVREARWRKRRGTQCGRILHRVPGCTLAIRRA